MIQADSTIATAEIEALRQTAVIIPARNEEQSIGLVLKDLPAVSRVIVVDNGSIDCTAKIAEAAGCVVVSEPIPGYGRACLTGMSRPPRRIVAASASAKLVAPCRARFVPAIKFCTRSQNTRFSPALARQKKRSRLTDVTLLTNMNRPMNLHDCL